MCEMVGLWQDKVLHNIHVSASRPRAMGEASNNNNTVCHQNNWD